MSEDYFADYLKGYAGSGSIGGGMAAKIMGAEFDADHVARPCCRP